MLHLLGGEFHTWNAEDGFIMFPAFYVIVRYCYYEKHKEVIVEENACLEICGRSSSSNLFNYISSIFPCIWTISLFD